MSHEFPTASLEIIRYIQGGGGKFLGHFKCHFESHII